MHPVFTKPLDAVTPDDLVDLCARRFLEGPQVEFKEALPAKSGRDKWHDGADSVGDHARNELLSEIVAFANSDSGTLIVGIREAAGNPPCAESLQAVPRCHDLAQRLENMAISCIDPPLPLMHIRSIETDGAGGGVILWRVQRSRNGPHRLTPTLHCYVRRGTVCQRLGMREIHDLTLRQLSASESIDRLFSERRRLFEAWVREATSNGSGSGGRATAVPLSPVPPVGRLHGRHELFRQWTAIDAMSGQSGLTFSFPAGPGRRRPVLRGLRSEYDDPPHGCRLELYEDGSVDLWFRQGDAPEERQGVRISWLAWAAANAVLTLDRFRGAVGMPDVEYSLEVEAARSAPMAVMTSVSLIPLFSRWGFDGARLHVSPGPLVLPRYSVGSRGEFEDLMNLIVRDVFDAAHESGDDERLTVQWPIEGNSKDPPW